MEVLDPVLHDIDWDDLTPCCDYQNFKGCTHTARFVAKMNCVPCDRSGEKLLCEGHSTKGFYCVVCKDSIPHELFPL